jgi:hypothetical protein
MKRETRTPGEDAWLDEMQTVTETAGTMSEERDKLRTILRAYRANLLTQAARDTNDLCEAISRIRWARGTDKLDAAIFEAVRIQSIVDASKPAATLVSGEPATHKEQK